jgi:hypothetical protein
MAKKTENITVSEEIERLSEIYKNIDGDKAAVVRELIQNAAYTAVTLRELQKEITKYGAIQDYNNGGGQSGKRISPALQAYTKLISTYNGIIKQLVGLLPKSEQELARMTSDPMADFLNE